MEDGIGTALYSESQTELYVPPPVENGVIPKNSYGNIDIYVPSMVPCGATHIIHPSIDIAAQFAGIDYADAVTGFDFVKQRASARVNGIIVAEENIEGLLTVWEGMMERVVDEEGKRRAARVLERWRRFMVGLEIKNRLDERHGRVDDEVVVDDDDGGGGFLLSDIKETSFGGGTEMPVDLPENIGQDGYNGNKNVVAGGALQPVRSGISYERVTNGEKQDDEQENVSPLDDDVAMENDFSGGFIREKYDSDGGVFEDGHIAADGDDSDEGGGFVYEDEDGIL
jgi:hypothetical protein